jgi:Tol biopolymer transport system component
MNIFAKGNLAPSRRGFAVFATLALVGLLAPGALPTKVHGQQQGEPARSAPAKFSGRIYLTTIGRDDPLAGIVAIDPNEGTWRKIAAETSQAVRVSPDGGRLAVNRAARAVDPGVWIYSTSGGEGAFRVTEKRGAPCWSPDSKEILVTTYSREDGSEVWRVAADGSHEGRAAIPATEIIRDWSPDGFLLTASRRKIPDLPLYLMRPDGTGERLLLATTNPLPDPGGILSPSGFFSPDGRKILFGRGVRDGEPPKLRSTSLLVLDVDGGAPRRLFEREVGDHFAVTPCWSPDGKAIAVLVVDERSEEPGGPGKDHIEIVSLDEKALKTIPLPEPALNRGLIDWR